MGMSHSMWYQITSMLTEQAIDAVNGPQKGPALGCYHKKPSNNQHNNNNHQQHGFARTVAKISVTPANPRWFLVAANPVSSSTACCNSAGPNANPAVWTKRRG